MMSVTGADRALLPLSLHEERLRKKGEAQRGVAGSKETAATSQIPKAPDL